MQASLDAERDAFLPLAENGSRLYFVIADLCKLNNMYRFSLNSFMRLFERALQKKTPELTSSSSAPGENGVGGGSGSGADTRMRIKKLAQMLKLLTYEYVCRSLFKQDRLMFALHLIHGTMPKLFKDNEWEFFTGMLVTNQKDVKSLKSSIPSWVADDALIEIAAFKVGDGSDHLSVFLAIHLSICLSHLP